jgi:hypothetical protein
MKLKKNSFIKKLKNQLKKHRINLNLKKKTN